MEQIIDEIRGRNAYELAGANGADCGIPDDGLSPGAKFLEGIRDEVLERIAYLELEPGDEVDMADAGIDHEIADGAVPIYTHQLMLTYVDLMAYQEDITDLGQPTDGIQYARWALYAIGSRLIAALVEEINVAIRAAASDEVVS